MKITKAKWHNNANSPVLFFIDDLCNKWVDLNGDGKIQPDEDYGMAGFDENGVFHFLENEILSANPRIKVTFFVPVDKNLADNGNKFSSKAYPINHSEKSVGFFRAITTDSRFELAYHGTNHIFTDRRTKDIIQEWESFKSLPEALTNIERGKSIFENTVGRYPQGGKYCGYISNEFSDESIDKSGFSWWCRYYNRAAINGSRNDNGKYTGRNINYCGTDSNPLTAFDVKLFGQNKVIDIPTTLNGNIFNPVHKPGTGLKNTVKKLLRPLILRRKLKEIDYLLKNKLVISIQEHMSPAHESGKRQSPNIFDDKDSLLDIFDFVRGKNVWYATGTELANYLEARENTQLVNLDKDRFKVCYKGRIEKPWLSLLLEESDSLEIIAPSGKTYKSTNNNLKKEIQLVNIEVEEGEYQIIKF